MSPARQLAELLRDEGVGVFGGNAADEWSINVSREPPAPDNAITLYDTGGLNTIETESQLRNPTIQVRVRSKDYEAARAKHDQIHDLLVLPTGRTLGGFRYLGISLQGDIGAIGRDENDRQLMTANYRILRQPTGETT